MNADDNLYTILGVSSSAGEAEIKSAYRHLSMRNHPDRNPGDPAAAARSAKINQAYEVLSQPELRVQYDAGRVGPDGQERPSAGISEELFAAMFGGGGPGMGVPVDAFGGDAGGVRVFHVGGMGPPGGMGFPNPFGRHGAAFAGGPAAAFAGGPAAGPPPVPDVENRVRVPIDKAYTGCTVPLELRRWIVQGQSEREERETLYITVPVGVDDNEIIRLPGKGNVVEGRHGDVKVFVDVENKTDFRRDGLDLVYKCSVSLKEALSGPSFDLRHLDGRTFRVKGTGTVVSPGSKRVLRGLGMHRAGKKGNLVVEYDVQFPLRLSKEQVSKLQDIL
jgi:DnaJ-class molecular chaperone